MPDEIPPGELEKRNRERAAFYEVFKSPSGPFVLEKIGDICHFYGPAETEADMVLQNAFKTMLCILGVWGDSDEDRREVTRKLLGG
jgi:hypothetical protein